MRRLLLCVLASCSLSAFGQGVKISTSGGNPDNAAILDLESDVKGFLPPRLTTEQRDNIAAPIPRGLRIYNLDTDCENFYNGLTWQEVCGVCTPLPTAANAGADQLGVSGTDATLGGNTPVAGTGQWTIISGSGGTFAGSATSSSPSAVFSGVASTSYVLRWTISTVCGSSEDDVEISFASQFCDPNPPRNSPHRELRMV